MSSVGTSTGRGVGSGERAGVGDASATVGAAVTTAVAAAVVATGLGLADGVAGAALGLGDGLGAAVAGDGGAVVGDGDTAVAPPTGAQARGSTPGGAAHTERAGCTQPDPSDAVRESDTRMNGWRAVLGAPQVPPSQTSSSVTVSPSIVAVLAVRRHRPPTSSPRAYSARTSRSKLMKRRLAGGKRLGSLRLLRNVSYCAAVWKRRSEGRAPSSGRWPRHCNDAAIGTGAASARAVGTSAARAKSATRVARFHIAPGA